MKKSILASAIVATFAAGAVSAGPYVSTSQSNAWVDIDALNNVTNQAGTYYHWYWPYYGYYYYGATLGNLDLDATAIGNVVDLTQVRGLRNWQRNVAVDIDAVNNVKHNTLRAFKTVDLDATAVGNALTVDGVGCYRCDGFAFSTQSNYGVSLTALNNFQFNRGAIGDLNLNATAVGNSFSIGE